jgi:LAGLIDADG-like domain
MVSGVNPIAVRRLYVEEGLSRDKISQMLGVNHSIVTNALRQSGVKPRPQRTPIIVTELTESNPNRPRIMISRGRVIVRHQVRLTLNLAYLLGWIIGDGYANRREIDAIVSLRESKLVEPLFRAQLERFGSVFVVPRHGAHIIRCNSTVLARVLCTATGKRYWTNIDFILQSPRFAPVFIAGFWDADGGVFHEANGAFRAHLYNSRLLLLEKIVHALNQHLGIEVKVYKRKQNRSLPETKIHARSDRYDLYVRAKSNHLWAKRIGRHMLLPWKRP